MIAAFDRAALRRIAETDSRLLDVVMPRLSRLANHGWLWIAVAAALRASGDRLAEQKRQEAIAAAEQITVKAREAMSQERDRLMAEMKQELGRLVVDTTTRVTGKVLTPDDHQRISEETARQIAA